MSFEIEVLISFLKHTRNGPVTHKIISEEAKVPQTYAIKLLRKWQKASLIYFHDRSVEAEPLQRLGLAFLAINLGADSNRVSRTLDWKEFEAIASMVLLQNGYSVARNVHFTQTRKKWEIDVLGYRKPFALCIDCKHWKRSVSPSILKKIVDLQVERTIALVDSLRDSRLKVKCDVPLAAKFIPMVLCLSDCAPQFCDNVPVVSILRIQDFLNQFPTCTDSLVQIEPSDCQDLRTYQKLD